MTARAEIIASQLLTPEQETLLHELELKIALTVEGISFDSGRVKNAANW